MEQYLELNNVNFVGLGKLLFSTNEKYNIPQLHFLVFEEDDELVAVNIEMQLFATGDTNEYAIANLISLTTQHIQKTMENERIGYQQFIDDVKSCLMEKYWAKYRELEFIAGQEKKDLSNNIEQRIKKILKEMIIEELKKQNIDIADLLGKIFDAPEILYKEVA